LLTCDLLGALRLPPDSFHMHGVEYYGGVGFLKAGLQFADAITTVSPSYANEIMTPEGGMGLDGLIRQRAGLVHGIVNVVDTDEWNPERDRHLVQGYGPESLDMRATNRMAVEQRFGLEPSHNLLITIVSRLTWQKGMDVDASELDAMSCAGARFAILDSGDPALEASLRAAAARHPGKVGVLIGYDEGLSHLLQGGADAILVPSRFEPCGLTQLYGLRYGCIPLVARVGGLGDTIIDANEAAIEAGVATGFAFMPGNGEAMLRGIERAVLLHDDAPRWRAMQLRGMKSDVSWNRSATRYAALYRSLL